MKRCFWVDEKSEIYLKYHDEEWGVPKYDDRELFELLVLESFQAGLSWLTVLKKREAFRDAFDNFDVNKVAFYNEAKVESLLQNENIKFGSFDKYIWSFTDNKQIDNKLKDNSEIPAKNELSDKISKDLIKRGFKFVGSVIIYSYMQGIGIVNDHEKDCFRY